MTKEEAVVCLLAWKDRYVPKHNLDFGPEMKRGITSGLENVYLNGLIEDLIERIRNSEFDPITEVAMHYYELDELLATSDDDHFITHRFVGYMEDSTHAILSYLQKIEREILWGQPQEDLGKKIVKNRIQHYMKLAGMTGSAESWIEPTKGVKKNELQSMAERHA